MAAGNAAAGMVDDAALKAGTIAAAGLDCVEDEPTTYPDLLALPNAVFAPPIGSATPATRASLAMLALRSLVMGVNGQAPPRAVQA